MKSTSTFCCFGTRLSSIALSCLLFLPTLSLASFEKALEIYAAGEYDKAEVAFEALAAIGDRSSMFNLGVMYYRGEIGDRDPVRAYVMMKFANDGIGDESFQRTTNTIFSALSEEQKRDAEALWVELEPKYDAETIRENIFPVLLDDEDCAPEPVAIKRKVPKYPRSQQREGHMGLTYLEFTISPEGYPRDVLVIGSTNKAFSEVSVKAQKQNLYQLPDEQRLVFGYQTVFTYLLRDGYGKKTQLRTKALEQELSTLQAAANSGDVFAQYKYGSKLNVFRYFQSYLKDVDLQYRSANEWFTKSAKNGLPNAQFEIGRNMMKGRGCEVDEVNGYKWVKAAAIAGYSPAQRMLAQTTLADQELSDSKALAAVSWLRNAALSDYYPAKLMLAWELSTSSSADVREGNEALALLEEKPEKYFDELRIFETKAAAYAEIGEFKKAIKYQKKALKLAKKADWDIPLVRERLGLYEHNEPYRGAYY